MQRMRQETHEEIMELISALSDGTISDHSSSVCNFSCLRITVLIICSSSLVGYQMPKPGICSDNYLNTYLLILLRKLRLLVVIAIKAQDISWSRIRVAKYHHRILPRTLSQNHNPGTWWNRKNQPRQSSIAPFCCCGKIPTLFLHFL